MPIYSYKCEEHGEFDKLVSSSQAETDQECPVCMKECHRVFSAYGTGFQLKGDWFRTSGKY